MGVHVQRDGETVLIGRYRVLAGFRVLLHAERNQLTTGDITMYRGMS